MSFSYPYTPSHLAPSSYSLQTSTLPSNSQAPFPNQLTNPEMVLRVPSSESAFSFSVGKLPSELMPINSNPLGRTPNFSIDPTKYISSQADHYNYKPSYYTEPAKEILFMDHYAKDQQAKHFSESGGAYNGKAVFENPIESYHKTIGSSPILIAENLSSPTNVQKTSSYETSTELSGKMSNFNSDQKLRIDHYDTNVGTVKKPYHQIGLSSLDELNKTMKKQAGNWGLASENNVQQDLQTTQRPSFYNHQLKTDESQGSNALSLHYAADIEHKKIYTLDEKNFSIDGTTVLVDKMKSLIGENNNRSSKSNLLQQIVTGAQNKKIRITKVIIETTEVPSKSRFEPQERDSRRTNRDKSHNRLDIIFEQNLGIRAQEREACMPVIQNAIAKKKELNNRFEKVKEETVKVLSDETSEMHSLASSDSQPTSLTEKVICDVKRDKKSWQEGTSSEAIIKETETKKPQPQIKAVEKSVESVKPTIEPKDKDLVNTNDSSLLQKVEKPQEKANSFKDDDDTVIRPAAWKIVIRVIVALGLVVWHQYLNNEIKF